LVIIAASFVAQEFAALDGFSVVVELRFEEFFFGNMARGGVVMNIAVLGEGAGGRGERREERKEQQGE